MPFPAAWIVLDIIILTEVCQREANTVWYHLYVNLKCDTNELTYEIETDSQTQRTDLWLLSGGGVGGNDWDFGISRWTLLYIE